MSRHLSLPILTTAADAAAWLRQHTAILCTDSRKVQAGNGFVAWPGAAHDARAHVLGALQQGAAACLVEAEGIEAFDFMQSQHQALVQDRVACVPGLRRLTGQIADLFYGEPSSQLQIVAATGTNGKTSTSWWLAQALARVPEATAGCALVGTLGVGRFVQNRAELHYTGMTTPDPVLLQGLLHDSVEQGVRYCAMEASSIGVAEHRLDGVRIAVALFTNFTQDHLDYHGTMEAYWQAKRALFDWPGLRAAVINLDDAFGTTLAQELADSGLDLWTVSCEDGRTARLRASDIRYADDGLVFQLHEAGAPALELRTALIGQYNVSNMLGVIASMRALGISLQAAVAACTGLLPVPGRMECLPADGQPLAVVDYAHTPDALEKALQALQPLAQQRGGRLWCVFGCGGDRDPVKRPLMGRAAEAACDQLLVTSDNPRSEDPQRIIGQVVAGLQQPAQARVEPDRARAIALALQQAAPQDVVLVAGKGHEDYQDIQGVKLPFKDQEQVQMAQQQRLQAGVTEGEQA